MAQTEKSQFKLDSFLSSVRTRGLARVNRFEVFITPPRALLRPNVQEGERSSREEAELSSLLCELSNYPPINLSVKPFKIFGPSYQRPITSEYGGDGISMTFHVDNDMLLKRFFEDWIENVVNNDDFTVNYQDDYATEIFIRQLNEEDTVTYEIKLIDAFPRSITLMELNQSAQNQTHRLNIIFAYRYWMRTDKVQEIPVIPLRIVPDVTPFLDLPARRGVSWNLDNNLGGQIEGGSGFAVSA